MDSDSDGYEIDFEESYDHSNENTGTDIFVVDHKYIDYNGFPEIYEPFYPHIELISNDVMNNIIKYVAENNSFSIISLRCVSNSMKNSVDDFMNMKRKRFYHKPPMSNRFICDNLFNRNIYRDYVGFYHKWRRFSLCLLSRRK